MRPIAILFAAASTIALQANILYLRDGSRYRGKLISQEERQIAFRIVPADGRPTTKENRP